MPHFTFQSEAARLSKYLSPRYIWFKKVKKKTVILHRGRDGSKTHNLSNENQIHTRAGGGWCNESGADGKTRLCGCEKHKMRYLLKLYLPCFLTFFSWIQAFSQSSLSAHYTLLVLSNSTLLFGKGNLSRHRSGLSQDGKTRQASVCEWEEESDKWRWVEDLTW